MLGCIAIYVSLLLGTEVALPFTILRCPLTEATSYVSGHD